MLTHQALLNIFEAKQHRVIVIKGPWGIGKTYFWNDFLKNNRASLGFANYSYVSLFGVQSVEAMRTQISANVTSLVGDEASLAERGSGIITWMKKQAVKGLNLAEMSYVASPVVGRMIEESMLKDLLICFDDIERKGAALKIGEVLGLVSQLKETRNCTIVIINNDVEFEEADKTGFDEYREKVVDCELSYSPMFKANLGIVFGNSCPPIVEDVLQKLSLNNIRIMKRIKWALDYFSNLAAAFPDLQLALHRQIASITAIHHAFSDCIAIEELDELSYIVFGRKPEEAKRVEPLTKIKYMPHPLSPLIIEYHKNGYIDFEAARSVFEKANAERHKDKVNEEHRALWHLYHDNFVCSQEEFMQRHDDFLREHVDTLSLRDIAIAAEFLDSLGPSTDRNATLEKAIAKVVAEHDMESLQRHVRGRGVLDRVPQRVARRIAKEIRAKQSSAPPGIRELMDKLAGRDSWDPEFLPLLDDYKTEDFVHWISNEDQVDVIQYLRDFISRFTTNQPVGPRVIARIKKALARIKKRSKLDGLRVKLVLERNG